MTEIKTSRIPWKEPEVKTLDRPEWQAKIPPHSNWTDKPRPGPTGSGVHYTLAPK